MKIGLTIQSYSRETHTLTIGPSMQLDLALEYRFFIHKIHLLTNQRNRAFLKKNAVGTK